MSNKYVSYEPTRSMIYVDCADEDSRIKLQYWLYRTHIPDSISQFGPYAQFDGKPPGSQDIK